MTEWMLYGLFYTATLIWFTFYADDGYVRYVPKRLRWKTRLTNYYAYLKAWMKHYHNSIASRIFQWRVERKLRRIIKRQNHDEMNRQGHERCANDESDIEAQAAVLAHQASIRETQRNFILDSDSKPLGIDNRATAFISGDISDFEGPLHESDRVVRGFGGARVTGVKQGTAVIRLEDDDGKIHRLRLPRSYYVQGSKDRLFSPQHFAQEYRRATKQEASETTTASHCVLTWGNYRRTIPLDPITNVATVRTAPSYTKFEAYCAEAEFDNDQEWAEPMAFDTAIKSDDEQSKEDTAGDDYQPSQPSARGEDTAWKDSHLPNSKVPRQQPAIIEQEEVEQKARNDEGELLAIHLQFNHAPFSKLQAMAKQGTIPRRLAKCRVPVCAACMYGKATKRAWRCKTSDNRAKAIQPTEPGQVVSVDQLESPTPGFVAQLTGILMKKRYKCATVFVDQYSGRGYVHLQAKHDAEETLEAKRAWERICLQDGVKVQHYHADNGIFQAKTWQLDCREKNQGLTFAGVDAHHQNGRAEARIRRLQELTRTMMLHAMRQWPQEICTNLWPYALRMANDSINATPNMSDEAKRTPDQMFSKSDVTSNPKHWKHFGSPVFKLEKALRGTTGHVSPQFHVKHDSNFDTIPQLYHGRKHESEWQKKAGLERVEEKARGQREPVQRVNKEAVPQEQPSQHLGGEPRRFDVVEENERRTDAQSEEEPRESDTQPPDTSRESEPTRPPDVTEGTRRRSARQRKPVERLIEAMRAEVEANTNESNEIFSYQAMFPRDDMELEGMESLLAMKAKADPDTLYLHEAKRQPDWKDFSEAMQLEVEQQVSVGVYSITKRSEVPEGATILPAVWQLRRKRDQRTGEIKKYKARCNIDGSRMKYGEHYEQTYAPVAGWTAIRLVLAFVLLFKWHAVQLDYVLAYPQAPAVRDLYMTIPKGFTLDGVNDPNDYVLRVNKNIYGGKDAGRTWYLYLRKKLEKLGFEPSAHDDCLFYKGNMVYVLYTDDSILVGPDKKEIDETIKSMQTELDLTIEGNLSDFLGVNIDRRDDGTIKLSQPKLIDQIIKDLNLDQESTKTKSTPAASSKLLSRHEDNRPFDGHFNYRSVIGKMHYLVAGSRNEISYAVHQCARFGHDPKMEHAAAVKWIGRYLKGTRTDGTILKPDRDKSLEVYVDADFAGNWDPECAHKDRSTARSRHGYYIMYGGIPIAWKSTLQQEIALSSTESEITGLSYALREAIPVINILEEMKSKGFSDINTNSPKVHCKVFEDNSGAVEIARHHKFRPRTKHLNNRLWHFRTFVNRGIISIHPIGTYDQPADILTKPLNETDFERHRKRVNGW